METRNFHILKIKWIGMTNTRPAMVRIISERFEQSLTIPFTNEPGDSIPEVVTAKAYLKQQGYDIIGHGEGKGCMYVITDTFKPLKEKTT